MIKSVITSIAIMLAVAVPQNIFAQRLIESVAGIVGNELILLSEIEEKMVYFKASNPGAPSNEIRCNFFEEAAIEKLFIDQARIDSIIVTPSMVDGDLNMRLNSFIMELGSEEALEEYYKKSIFEIKNDLREMMVNETIVRSVQQEIAEGISVTPAEVRRYYNSLHKDSITLVPARVSVSIIQVDPPENEENRLIARQRLLDLRSDILGGRSFELMARLYSEDSETAVKGGETGFLPRGRLAKEYADVAFSMKENTVSRVVETEYGFHIIQLIERRGDMVNTRHILISAKLTQTDINRAITKLDSVADVIREGSASFGDMARKISTHKQSRTNGGKLVQESYNARVSEFAYEELNRDMYQVIRNMKVGEISKAYRTKDERNRDVFRIVRLDKEIPAHVANLEDDYELLHQEALNIKQEKVYREWIEKKAEVTYIRISEEFMQCNFRNSKWLR